MDEHGGGSIGHSARGYAGTSSIHDNLRREGFTKTGDSGHKFDTTPHARTTTSEQTYSHPEGHTATVKNRSHTMIVNGRPRKNTEEATMNVKVAPQGEGGSKFAIDPNTSSISAQKVHEHLQSGNLRKGDFIKSQMVKGWGHHTGDYNVKTGVDHHVVTPQVGTRTTDEGHRRRFEGIGKALTNAGVHHEVKDGEFHIPIRQPKK